MTIHARDELFNSEMLVHYKAVFTYLVRMTRCESTASDLTQDTFARAYVKLEQYTPGTYARAWLLKVAQNVFINEYRKSTRRGEQSLEDNERLAYNLRDEAHPMAGFADLRASGMITGGDFGDEVTAALARLTDEQRSILIMSNLMDIPGEEIAQSLGMPLNTVKGKIRRARLALIEVLSDYAAATYGIHNTRNLG